MLKQKFVLNFFSKIFLYIFQMAAGIVVARIAGPTVLGTVAFGAAYVGSFLFIATLGLGAAHTKLLSGGEDEGKCIATFARLKIFSTSLFLITIVGFFLVQKYLFGVEFESKTHIYVIFVAIVVGVVQSLLRIPTGTFGAKVEIAKSVAAFSLQKIIYQILRIIVVLLGYKALTIAFSNLISLLLSIPLILYLFKDYSFGSYDKELAKKYIKIAAPTLLIMLTATLLRTLDKVLLQFFYDSQQVGYYTAGYRFGGLLLMLTIGVSPFFPLFSKAYSENNLTYIKDKIDKYLRFIFIFVMPLVIFIAIYSDSIILLVLGKQYIHSIDTMAIITVAIFIQILAKPFGNVLTGKGLFKLAAILEFINLVIFVVALVVLIHPQMLALKATGAALAFLLVNLSAVILFIYFAKKELPILSIFKNSHFVVFGILNFSAFYFFYKHFLGIYGINFRIAFPFVYYLLTYGFLILSRWINTEDFLIVKAILDFKTMKKYVSGEMKNKK